MFQSTINDKAMVARVRSVISSLPGSDTRLQQIIEAQEEDPLCSSRSKCSATRDDLTRTHRTIMVLSLIVQNSHTLPRSGESNTPEIVQNIPRKVEKSSANLEQAAKNLPPKKMIPIKDWFGCFSREKKGKEGKKKERQRKEKETLRWVGM